MYIQYVDIKYVLHHVLQLALRVPKWNVFDWLTVAKPDVA